MSTQEYLDEYFKMSGEIIAYLTSIEYFTTFAIARHFCSPSSKESREFGMARIDEVVFVLNENIRSIESKLKILDSILKTHYAPFLTENPTLISDIKTMNKYRIKFAHHQVRVPEDILTGNNSQKVEKLQGIFLVEMNPEPNKVQNEIHYTVKQHRINIGTLKKCSKVLSALLHIPPSFKMKN